MHPATLRAAALSSLLAALILGGACTLSPLERPSPPAPAPTPTPVPAVTCTSTSAASAFTAFSPADVGVYFETQGDAGLEIVRADLASYLGQLWGGTYAVSTQAPDLTRRVTVWLSTSAGARSEAGLPADRSYAIVRTGSASRPMIVVAANDKQGLAYGAYALLEELGIRFFHPKDELVPHLGAPRIPASLGIYRAPAADKRGIQFHTLHPIEYFDVFNGQGPDNLADAKRVIDWLVKTGQSYVQWPLLSTVDFKAFSAGAQAIIDYAHLRGVKVGAVVQVWGGASLQNNYVLVSDETNWQMEMDAGLDQLVTIGWDTVELALGELVSSGPQAVIDWLNHAVAHLAAVAPTVEVNVQNHVGNYPNLWVQYQGQTVFYYHLPQFADARLGQTVHTLFFFDVYRDWATYAHPDFHLQHDYIFQELSTRRVSYFPESAYWISADIDVPLFLPEYLYARWNDIHTMAYEVTSKGMPKLQGHVTFSSGHEWGYWMTDYLTARMLWQPDEPLTTFLAHVAAPFGSCAGDMAGALGSLVDIQSRYLFDQRLVAYVQGENTTVDIGYLAGLETHPKRVAFEDVLAMNAQDRATFETSVVAPLEAMVAEMRPVEDTLAAQCQGSDAVLAHWCDEIWDGTAVTRNRAQHAALLYRAILARAAGTDPETYYQQATALTSEAAAIVARREPHYRFDLARVTSVYQNPTVYDFGYLRPAHTQCYWTRREQQVRTLLDTGYPEAIALLPACTDE